VAIYELVCAGISSYVARVKRRDQGNWFIIGLALGIIGIAFALFMRKLSFEEASKNNLLLDAGRYLRSGWRFLLFFVVLMVIYYLTAVIAKLTRIVPEQSFLFLFYLDVLVATFVMLRWIDRRRLSSVGFPYHGKIMREIILGFLIGTLMIGTVVGAELIVGAVRLHLRSNLGVLLLLRNFGLSFLFFAYFAAGEELIFRGYPYQTLVEGMGALSATILMSLIFGLLHLMNPDASIFSTLNTALAGALLSVAYLKTRTLYLPFGIHFAWNFMQSFVLSLPVSGLITNRTIFVPTDYGPDWLTGGRYGPEAGIGTTVVMIAGILYFVFEKKIKPSFNYEEAKKRIVAAL
jgi:membrane protease YdiL (CAAX protease family)